MTTGCQTASVRQSQSQVSSDILISNVGQNTKTHLNNTFQSILDQLELDLATLEKTVIDEASASRKLNAGDTSEKPLRKVYTDHLKITVEQRIEATIQLRKIRMINAAAHAFREASFNALKMMEARANEAAAKASAAADSGKACAALLKVILGYEPKIGPLAEKATIEDDAATEIAQEARSQASELQEFVNSANPYRG